MNIWAGVGRLTAAPDVRTNDEKTITRFTMAVDRKFKTEGGQDADFIDCVAFGKTAEFIEKYFGKGNRIGVTGRIQTGSYTNKEGKKVYSTDIVVEQCEFVESKHSAQTSSTPKTEAAQDGFFYDPLPDEGLPFQS